MPFPAEWIDAIRAWRTDPARPSGLLGLAALAREAYALSHSLLSLSGPLTAAQGPVSCGKGCAACCREVIPLSPPEALLLAETHARLDWELRGEAEERRRRITLTLAESGFAHAALIDRSADIFALGLPCPYLENETCGIHGERPLACREHLAVSPAENCGGFPDPSIRTLDLPASVGEALTAVAADLMGYREAIPMARITEWLEANQAVALKEWDAGFLLDLLVARALPTGPK
jgi:Fe-S-cluster containining protein